MQRRRSKRKLPANLISSQRYLDESIVKEKQARRDYSVQICGVTAGDGKRYKVVVDGHHSLEAAKRDRVPPELEPCNSDVQREANHLGDNWLLQHQHDSDWYFVSTGRDVW